MARSNSMVVMMLVMMLVMMVAAFQLQSTIAQTRHVVGGALGWTVPPNGDVFYTSWASEQTFMVGDTLTFNFTNGVHDVAEVSQNAYGPCTKTNLLAATANGPATLTLTTSGKHYYVCTVGTHCRIGQKLTINVAPRTFTSPTTIDTMPSSPTTPSSTPPSHATTCAAVVPFIFLWVCLLTLIDY